MKAPLFIVGTGRSGTTILFELITCHPRVGWPAPMVGRWPRKLWLNRLYFRILEWPVIGPWVHQRMGLTESYSFWDSLFPGFSLPCRDLLASDVTPWAARAIRNALAQLLPARTRRDTLVMKITGWPRIGFLREIFPEAKFIHIYRDGRAVASSLMRMSWWWGWRGPENWRWGPLPEKYQQAWEASGRCFAVLAGIQWLILMDAFEQAIAKAGESVLSVSYERLCGQTQDVMKEICEWSGLGWNEQMARAIGAYQLRSANDKWRRDLNPVQQERLNKLLAPRLKALGYEV